MEEEKLVTLAILTYSKAQILKNVLENTYLSNPNYKESEENIIDIESESIS